MSVLGLLGNANDIPDGTMNLYFPSVKEALAPRSLRLGQCLVAAVAERGVGAVFALAPPDGFLFPNFELHGLQAGAFVGAIAEGLMAGASA
jgi:hypothetical protein